MQEDTDFGWKCLLAAHHIIVSSVPIPYFELNEDIKRKIMCCQYYLDVLILFGGWQNRHMISGNFSFLSFFLTTYISNYLRQETCDC